LLSLPAMGMLSLSLLLVEVMTAAKESEDERWY
jgi:hypothetical protein